MTANLIRKLLGFSTVAWLFVPAVAQFEISPDHFDEPSPAKISRPVKPQTDIHSKIREQQRLLERYNAQIKAKLLEVDAAMEDLINHGNQAGRAEACRIHQRELEKLTKDLALPISQAQARLTSLKRELNSVDKPRKVGQASVSRKRSPPQSVTIGAVSRL